MLSSILSRSTAFRQVARGGSVRFMSVINLSDAEAVEKFRMINSKSVLYFTAAVCIMGGSSQCIVTTILMVHFCFSMLTTD